MFYSSKLCCIIIKYVAPIVFTLIRLSLNHLVVKSTRLVLDDQHLIESLANLLALMHLTKIVLVHLQFAPTSHNLTGQCIVTYAARCVFNLNLAYFDHFIFVDVFFLGLLFSEKSILRVIGLLFIS